jgi:hypothetical protein
MFLAVSQVWYAAASSSSASSASSSSLLSPSATSLGKTEGNQPKRCRSTVYSPMAPCVTSTPSARRAAACRPAPLGPFVGQHSATQAATTSKKAGLTRGLIPPLLLITRCQGTLSLCHVVDVLLGSELGEGRCFRHTPTCLRNVIMACLVPTRARHTSDTGLRSRNQHVIGQARGKDAYAFQVIVQCARRM